METQEAGRKENHLLEVSVGDQLDVRGVSHGGRRPLEQTPELRVEGGLVGATQVSDLRVEQDQGGPGSPVRSHRS